MVVVAEAVAVAVDVVGAVADAVVVVAAEVFRTAQLKVWQLLLLMRVRRLVGLLADWSQE